MKMRGCVLVGLAALLGAAAVPIPGAGAEPPPGAAKAQAAPEPQQLAGQIDALIDAALAQTGVEPAPLVGDEDFLRRVSVDLTGRTPTPEEVTLFVLRSDPNKRAQAVEQLLNSPDYASNWARYWRDVIYSRTTEQRARIGMAAFETWMREQIAADKGWHEVATALITAMGDISSVGETGLLMAQGADAAEVASEVSRIFLGIQIQCANCHDHPTDKWTREQFHQLAAYFPRIRVQQTMTDNRRSFVIASVEGGMGPNPAQVLELLRSDEGFGRLDRDGDGKITRQELRRPAAGGQILARLFDAGDLNKDGGIDRDEIKKLPAPPQQPGRGAAEHFMPNLDDPTSRGTRMEPRFFLSGESLAPGRSDGERRAAVAAAITSPTNEWFAKAYVNRIWGELLGEGFTMPIDDMGPDRTVSHPEVLDRLAKGFTASGYSPKWLLRTITATATYQRSLRARSVSDAASFASARPSRLRGDAIYDALRAALGLPEEAPVQPALGPNQRFNRDFGLRAQVTRLFGFDPSTPQDELVGTVPQALFLMNNPQINRMIAGVGPTRLAAILRKYPDNDDALRELYLNVLSREPSERELQVGLDYIQEVGSRTEAFEDLMWALLNSAEFQSRR